MKRTVLTCAAGFVTMLAVSLPTAAGSGVKFKPCSNTYYAPQYLTIKHVYQVGTTCTVAHGVAHSYMNAVTSSSGSTGSRTGQCFGAHSYGKCQVRFERLAYQCFHFSPVPKRTRGLVRCQRPGRQVSFNITT